MKKRPFLFFLLIAVLMACTYSLPVSLLGTPQGGSQDTPFPPTFMPVPLTATPIAAPGLPCRIAYIHEDGDVYFRNCDGSGVRQVTFLGSVFLDAGSYSLTWSPDGQSIVFPSTHERQTGDGPSLYIIQMDGSNLTRLTFGDRHDKSPAWSPDGLRIAMHRNCTLVTMAPDGSDEQVIVSGTEICPNTIAWSPDSQQLAFVSWHDPFPAELNFIVYVVNRDGSNLREIGIIEDGMDPTWSPDGTRIGFDDLGSGEGAYLLDPDGIGAPEPVASIPPSWHHWCWPQWGR